MRDSKAYCLHCFEILFADPCVTCHQLIAVDDPRMNSNGRQWHATAQCFICAMCSCPLIGKPFMPTDDDIFCSSECSMKYGNNFKSAVLDEKSNERLTENKNYSPKFIHINFNRFNLDELLRTSEDDDESDYESLSAKYCQITLENSTQSKLKSDDKARGTASDMMARSVMTDKSANDAEVITFLILFVALD